MLNLDDGPPGGPVVTSSPPNVGDAGLIPGWGTEIPRASWPKNQNMKQKQYCNKFNKGFKNSIKDGMGEMEVYFSFKGLPL